MCVDDYRVAVAVGHAVSLVAVLGGLAQVPGVRDVDWHGVVNAFDL